MLDFYSWLLHFPPFIVAASYYAALSMQLAENKHFEPSSIWTVTDLGVEDYAGTE